MFVINKGNGFKRCSIDSVFYVEGTPGEYKIRKRNPSNENDKKVGEEEDLCLTRLECDYEVNASTNVPLAMGPCTHCGAKQWNILGDASSGYVIIDDEKKLCLARKSEFLFEFLLGQQC